MTQGGPLRPRALRTGDLVGVCAPSGTVPPRQLKQGVRELEALGFRVHIPPGVLAEGRLSAGTVERRVAELHELYADGDVAAIVLARGGVGAGWLRPSLDADLIRAHPKVLMGYSDATSLLLYLDSLDRVGFHGPMVCFGFGSGRYDRASLLQAVSAEGGLFATRPDDMVALREGEGEGRLRGGTLSVVCFAAGTPWALRPHPEGTILFLEEQNEKPWRLACMLCQLRQSGALEGVRGIVFGDMIGCAPPGDETYTLQDVLLDALAGLDVPIAMGLSSGHTWNPQVTLPFGVRARLVCGGGEARFEILEPAVEP